MEKKPIFCCGMEITGTEHGEWQGTLRTEDGVRAFHSVLELILMINSDVGAAAAVGTEKEA
jgi:hypothetical protein